MFHFFIHQIILCSTTLNPFSLYCCLGLPQSRCSTLHLAILKIMMFTSAHLSRLSRSRWMVPLPSVVSTTLAWCHPQTALWPLYSEQRPESSLPHLMCFCGLSSQGWKLARLQPLAETQGRAVTAWYHASVSLWLLDPSQPGHFLSQPGHLHKTFIKLGMLAPMTPHTYLSPLGDFQGSGWLCPSSGGPSVCMCQPGTVMAPHSGLLPQTIAAGAEHFCFNRVLHPFLPWWEERSPPFTRTLFASPLCFSPGHLQPFYVWWSPTPTPHPAHAFSAALSRTGGSWWLLAALSLPLGVPSFRIPLPNSITHSITKCTCCSADHVRKRRLMCVCFHQVVSNPLFTYGGRNFIPSVLVWSFRDLRDLSGVGRLMAREGKRRNIVECLRLLHVCCHLSSHLVY